MLRGCRASPGTTRYDTTLRSQLTYGVLNFGTCSPSSASCPPPPPLPPRLRCIINISSTSGTHGNAGQANYATAKAGVVGLTKAVAKEWGPFGVRCNALAFGLIDTRLTRSKEGGESIQVRACVCQEAQGWRS